MTDQAVLDVLRQRGLETQIAPFSPHDFRRTFASNMIDAGVDIVTVQNLMGHASPVTTARYDMRREEAKRRQRVCCICLTCDRSSNRDSRII
jgi:integrase/recombinase XerD